MPLDQTAPAVGGSTLADQGIAWRNNDRICGLPVVAGAPLLLGGSFSEYVTVSTFVRLPQSPGFEIDGALATYSSVYLEADAIRADDVSSTVNAVFDLWDATTGATVAGSELTISVDVAHPLTKPGKTSVFTINSGVRRYYFRLRSGTSGSGVAGFCKLVGKNS
ncbi:hypothetical protein [Luteitalea sp.]|uniref:hypothetical protein n=1 Tax=Luteitalea sp. TaxID=2004800 RepID=UPI0025C56FCA|nr:hypothetical protein [Luteitalea sp.]